VTLVSAPAGFGKTTCISEWVGGLDVPAAWLSLDPVDDDPGRFFTYLIAALLKIDGRLGREIEGVLRAGQLPPDEIISATLINDILALEGRFLLVLDDFHVIQDHFVLQVLAKLTVNLLQANLPQPLHLVILTREDPPLPLARLRANNQLTEIRAEDLRFTGDEAELFLNEVMGLSLSQTDIAVLEDKTEGWIAGLQLAGLSIRDQVNSSDFIASLSGSHRFILSYLTEEVLNRQPEEIQSFLLQTAVLDKLSGDLCDAVTSRTDSHLLLERLFNANLFLVPLDDEGQWYRYHHLFADLLRNRQSVLQKDRAAALHQRASRWYAQSGMATEAIQHALAAEDYAAALRLVEHHALDMVLQGYVKTVADWMQAIPQPWGAQSPRANLAFAWAHFLRGTVAHANPYLERLQALFTTAPTDETQDPALKAGWLALQSMALNAQGKPAESLTLTTLALDIVPEQDHYVRSLIYLGRAGAYQQTNEYARAIEAFQTMTRHGQMAGNFVVEMLGYAGWAGMALRMGKLQLAFEMASQGAERVEHLGVLPPTIATVYGELGAVYYQRNQLEQAHQYFRRAIQVSALSGYSEVEIGYLALLSSLHQTEGDLESSARELQKAVDLLQSGAPARVGADIIYQQVRFYLALDNPTAAEMVLRQSGVVMQDEVTHATDSVHMAYLRLMFYLGVQEHRKDKFGLGNELARRIIASAEAGQRIDTTLKALILGALIRSSAEDTTGSLEWLDRALALAEPEGYIRIFLDEGAPMAALLRRARGRGRHTGYIEGLLALFPGPAAETQPTQGRTEFVEPITRRELEILRLISEGCSNQEIAERLVITLHTVKKHSSNIFGKLGVNSRTQAVARARQLRLL
jgi:LuxR family maltose regulon positive regulatory protein